MQKLQRVVWEGHGARLLSEVSNQPVVKKFLEAVPYIMNTIRDIHSAVVENDLEGLMRHSGDPVPPQILSSRDANNMTVTHKAAGLGHGGILGYIAERYPEGINDVDNEGRTPLHYAAAVRDDQHMYNTLVGLGADESAVDNKNRTPGYYINRPQELDKNMLKTLPEAPRTPSSAYPASWDWKLLETEAIVELSKKSRRKITRASNENISSKNNSNSISDNKSTRRGMKNSSTQDLISTLPELDDKRHNGSHDANKESDVVEDNEVEKHEEEHNEVEDDKSMEENTEDTQNETGNIEKSNVENEEPVDEYAEQPHNDNDQQDEENPNDAEDNVKNEDEDHATTEINDELVKNAEDITEEKIDDDHATESEVEKHDDDENEEKDSNEHNSLQSHNKTPEHSAASSEGNKNQGYNEDDDDVQVQGDSHSEYSEIHQRSTAEATDTTSAKRGNETGGRNTQESLIEGIISGEAEQDSQDASIQKDESVQGEILVVDSEIDPEVSELINTANMEMLAQLVLNGEGSRLVGRRSRNTELQSFLDNVPTYMQKINKVHIAARDGNIRELQAALDRRKFAIARDPISPNGATPLHVATVFGKTNIIKYLGGRFPETLSAVDYEGRTALHYAAVVPDNGHYYNLMQQLGANSKDLDDVGKSAEDYYKDPSLLQYSHLLADFGIDEEAAQSMLTDKVPEDHVSSRRMLDTPEAIDTLERCYRLLQSARPSRTPLSASSNRSTPPVVLGRFLKRPIFDTLKYRVTKLDHDLFDVIWPAVKKLPDNRNIIQTVEEDFPGGITAPDYYVYELFHEFLTPLIKDIHNINVHTELPLHPPTDFDTHKPLRISKRNNTIELNIDPYDDHVLSGTIECSRNIESFELPLNLKIGQLEEVERIVTTLLMHEDFTKFSEQNKPESDQKGGSYYTLNEVLEKPSEICAALASAGLLIALCDREEIDDYTRLHGKHWPYGRGVFVNSDRTIAIWINVHDHIRVIISTPTDSPGELGLPFYKMAQVMTYLHERLDFVWDYKLGHLSSRPSFLGSGIRFSLIINFPGLSKDLENMKHLCAVRGLQYRETLNSEIARISNYQCLSLSEENCFQDFVTATSNLLALERDLSMKSSEHIAAMLTNIFKRKRSSLSDLEHSDHH
ncbi:hypothetical protein O0L34_g5928 [Tuta absoluta]|nr:hypothetical protein O0L34_g5928 [Tuta absoluta]